jgi:opacity protein-like surface antigen
VTQTRTSAVRVVLFGAAVLALALPVRAQTDEGAKVQIAPLAAWGFGGSVTNLDTGEKRSFEAAPVFGGALGVRVGKGWYTEGYFSRQSTKLAGGGISPDFDVALERYLLGIQQETGTNPRVRWFGTFWLGATRFIPGHGDFDSATKFTGGLGLGVKTYFTDNIGLRLEVRGFYTLVKGEGGLACVNGSCLFAFSGSGLWQGDVGGGLVFAF